MGINEALKILGLNNNYTEEELKKTYRKLIAKYHPDKYQGDKIFAENKTKQLNEARTVLVNNLKETIKNKKETYSNAHYKEKDNLTELKKVYLKELKSELEYINSIDSRDKIFETFRYRFLKIITKFYYYIDKSNSSTIKLGYTIYREKYFKLLCYYKYENWNKSKVIEFVNGSLKIDTSTSLKNVRRNMTMTINEILYNELDKVKMFDNYNSIQSLLLGIRDDYTSLCLWGYLDIETAKKDFINKVTEEIIKYNKREQKIDDLIKYQGYPTALVVELYNSILDEEKFNELYNAHVNKTMRIKIKIRKIFSK